MPRSAPRSGGSAYSVATVGRVAKNDVSNAATWVTPAPQTSRAALIHRSATGLCRGASSERAAIASRAESSSSAGPVKRVPPCTTRWATARGRSSSCSRKPRRVASGSREVPVRCCAATRLGGGPASPASVRARKAASLTEVLPVLTVNTIMTGLYYALALLLHLPGGTSGHTSGTRTPAQAPGGAADAGEQSQRGLE